MARPYALGIDRRREALEWIAFALGGEAGARLARELGLLVSPDTLLGRIRRALRPDAEDVRVLGVDDFVFRNGNLLSAALAAEADPAKEDEYGKGYALDIEMKTGAGTATVRSGWIVRRGEDFPRITSRFVL